MIMNSRSSRQAIPFCSLNDGEPLSVVSESRLLGLIFDADMTWWPLVHDLTNRCRAKIWSLVKLREVGADTDQLLSLYIARVRSTLESGAHVYGTVINGLQATELENVQRKCLQKILGTRSKGYESDMITLGLVTLESRRKGLMKNFAISTYRSSEHQWWYTPHPHCPFTHENLHQDFMSRPPL